MTYVLIDDLGRIVGKCTTKRGQSGIKVEYGQRILIEKSDGLIETIFDVFGIARLQKISELSKEDKETIKHNGDIDFMTIQA